ncbi:MAG TPA: sulfite dehydrogenase [Gammaproteobacteria bacterium]|jgi:sulfane dehydrogenase subunit SoxC|nr:sulfite dehydrogenase [Chromatiales bacterium]MCP4927202.1 sulfite dehydrogenase [Gammaproteobacteria bacterium]MDP7296904.1 sulfite dehydrogenase [Gammaproteobacteria bacterium]MDP7661361.1 sulfite dehydrogenase [Gammaproteobacteria bacterium]HJP39110.1 sulfite dehydrogenase [Gammaproteobacteria bacterium]
MSKTYPPSINRRQLLAAAGGVAVVQGASGEQIQVADSTMPTDPTKIPGSPATPVGDRSPFEKASRRVLGGAISTTPLQDLHGSITPASLHFERHHAGIPAIDPQNYELLIHGMVERPMKFSLAELKRFPATTRICFIECSGNLPIRANAKTTPQSLAGLTSQSEWTGVSLATLFREVGIRPQASWFLAEGSDAAVMTRSIPVAKALDDAMLAYAQNGAAVRPAQGYPVRLLLPGWEGNTSVKWLRRMELSDRPFQTREETSKYTDPLKDGIVRQFSFVMDARSIITFPAYPVSLEPGWIEIRGLAWTGRGHITGVDISTDNGNIWQPAALQAPILPKAHTRFRYLWKWDGSPTQILSRALDETGYLQPTRKQLEAARGAPQGPFAYHYNPITGWQIEADGTVLLAPDPG